MPDLTEQLVTAAEGGDAKAVTAALQAGADPNSQGPNAGALHVAAFGGHARIVKALLKAGADPSIPSAQGFTALHLAASRDHAAVVKVLVDAGAPLDAQTPAGGTPLHVALASGHNKSAQALMKAGASLEALDAQDRTALHTAAAAGNVAMVKALLKAGVAVDPLSKGGDTPLHEAIAAALGPKGELQSWSTSGNMGGSQVTYRITHGCMTMAYGSGMPWYLPTKDLRQIAGLSWAPPQLKRLLDHADCAVALLKAGANPNIADTRGFTSLHSACELGDPRVLQAMAKLPGVDWSARTNKQALPIHQAGRSKRPDGLEVVLKSCPKLVNTKDENGYTPLHYAADVGAPAELFQLLLDAGAKKGAKSTRNLDDIPKGITPAGLARYWKDEAAATLIEKG